MVALVPADLTVPEEEILRRADGDTSSALRIAAAYGYELACRDLDKATTFKKEAPQCSQ
jgi:hypothetical protein